MNILENANDSDRVDKILKKTNFIVVAHLFAKLSGQGILKWRLGLRVMLSRVTPCLITQRYCRGVAFWGICKLMESRKKSAQKLGCLMLEVYINNLE